MRRMMQGLAATLLCLSSPGRVAQSAPPAAAPAEPTDKPAVHGADSDRQVVARFTGGEITVAELQAALEAMPKAQRKAYFGHLEAIEALYRQRLTFALLVQAAREKGLETQPAVHEAATQSAVQTLVHQRIDDRVTPADVPETKVAAFYEAHKATYQQPSLRRASHIQFADRASALKQLRALKDADLATFRRAARRWSTDTSTQHEGGDLPVFAASGETPLDPDIQPVRPELARAAFALKSAGDQVRQPITHPGGFSLLMLSEIRPPKHQPLEEAGPAIRDRLVHEERRQALDTLITRLKTKQPLAVHAERLALIDITKLDADTTPSGPGIPQGFPVKRSTSSSGAAPSTAASTGAKTTTDTPAPAPD